MRGLKKRKLILEKVSMKLSWALIKKQFGDKIELKGGYQFFVIFTKRERRKMLFSLMLRLKEICCSMGMWIYSSIPGPICSAISSWKKSQGLFRQKFHFSLFSFNYMRQSFFVGIFLFRFGKTYFHSNRNSFNRISLNFYQNALLFLYCNRMQSLWLFSYWLDGSSWSCHF